MQRLLKLFGSWVQFFYFSFDRVVLHGHLTFFQREGNVVAFVRNLLGVPVLSKELLAKRTQDYNRWVAAFARNQKCPLEWAQPGQRKEDYVRPTLQRRRARQPFGVYFILMSMEQGPSFRISLPKFPTQDPNYRILRAQRSRYRHYYFYLYDQQLGAFCLRVGSFLPFPVTAYLNGHEFIARELTRRNIPFTQRDNSFTDVADVQALQAAADRFGPSVLRWVLNHWALAVGPKFSKKERLACQGLSRFWAVQQVEYCLNFIFKKNWPIRRLFERCCELSLYLIGADRIGQLFGARATRRIGGKLQNVMERLDQGMHVFRAYWKHSFLKQYEKWRTFLRLEVVGNRLRDFGLNKGLADGPSMRTCFRDVLERFAHHQAISLNVHGEFDLLARLAQPVQLGTTQIAGIKLEQRRLMRLLEILLRRAGGGFGGWTVPQVRAAVLDTFNLKPSDYSLNAVRYDLRKLRAHGLLERIPHTYRYRLTLKGQKAATLLTLLRKRIYGPIAAATFQHRPTAEPTPNSPFERAYAKVDKALDELLLALAA
jgi:hypothetical protein